MEQFVKRTLMPHSISIVLSIQIHVGMHSHGQYSQTQLKVKLTDGIEAKDITLPQCKEVLHLAMIFKVTLSLG
jgi:hypothetical protein